MKRQGISDHFYWTDLLILTKIWRRGVLVIERGTKICDMWMSWWFCVTKFTFENFVGKVGNLRVWFGSLQLTIVMYSVLFYSSSDSSFLRAENKRESLSEWVLSDPSFFWFGSVCSSTQLVDETINLVLNCLITDVYFRPGSGQKHRRRSIFVENIKIH